MFIIIIIMKEDIQLLALALLTCYYDALLETNQLRLLLLLTLNS